LEHCSANFHLILLTRSDPPLPLARYHARAQMVDIRAEDLKMNEAEMAALLNGLGICALSGSALAMLYQRTEGWSAGIHLSNLAVRKQPDPEAFVAAFSGSQRYILTIFRTRFLKAFPCSSRNFCLKHPFCASLMGPSVRPCWIIRTLHFFWNNFTSRTTFCSRWMMSGSGAVIPIFFEMYCSTV
jgi:LuxR family maltose regulon positive regulatory protein